MLRAVHAGKAAVAGLALPVAVGLEIIAVPGSGWYALYQVRGFERQVACRALLVERRCSCGSRGWERRSV